MTRRLGSTTDDRQEHWPYVSVRTFFSMKLIRLTCGNYCLPHASYLLLPSKYGVDIQLAQDPLALDCFKKLICSRAIFGEFLPNETEGSPVNLPTPHDEWHVSYAESGSRFGGIHLIFGPFGVAMKGTHFPRRGSI